MPKRKRFKKNDDVTFFQDVKDLTQDVILFFDNMPPKLKKWMHEATIIIDALQKLDDALQEGQPADKAIDFILGQIKGDADEAVYDAVKIALERLISYLNQFKDDGGGNFVEGGLKKDIASDAVIMISELNSLESDTVTQNAVYIYKS